MFDLQREDPPREGGHPPVPSPSKRSSPPKAYEPTPEDMDLYRAWGADARTCQRALRISRALGHALNRDEFNDLVQGASTG